MEYIFCLPSRLPGFLQLVHLNTHVHLSFLFYLSLPSDLYLSPSSIFFPVLLPHSHICMYSSFTQNSSGYACTLNSIFARHTTRILNIWLHLFNFTTHVYIIVHMPITLTYVLLKQRRQTRFVSLSHCQNEPSFCRSAFY